MYLYLKIYIIITDTQKSLLPKIKPKSSTKATISVSLRVETDVFFYIICLDCNVERDSYKLL